MKWKLTISGTISDVLLFFLKSPLLLSVNNKKEKILRIFLKYATIMLIKVARISIIVSQESKIVLWLQKGCIATVCKGSSSYLHLDNSQPGSPNHNSTAAPTRFRDSLFVANMVKLLSSFWPWPWPMVFDLVNLVTNVVKPSLGQPGHQPGQV